MNKNWLKHAPMQLIRRILALFVAFTMLSSSIALASPIYEADYAADEPYYVEYVDESYYDTEDENESNDYPQEDEIDNIVEDDGIYDAYYEASYLEENDTYDEDNDSYDNNDDTNEAEYPYVDNDDVYDENGVTYPEDDTYEDYDVSYPEDDIYDEYDDDSQTSDDYIIEEVNTEIPIVQLDDAGWVIIFDPNGGTTPEGHGERLAEIPVWDGTFRLGRNNMPNPPSHHNAVFMGWYTEPVLAPGTPHTFFAGDEAVSGALTLYAIWGHNLEFRCNQLNPPSSLSAFVERLVVIDGWSVQQMRTIRGNINWPTNPERPGYAFAYWAEIVGGDIGDEYTIDSPITRSINLFAQWTELPYHTITFHPEGGTLNPHSPEDMLYRFAYHGTTLWHGSNLELNHSIVNNWQLVPQLTPPQAGLTFEGWWIMPGGWNTPGNVRWFGPSGWSNHNSSDAHHYHVLEDMEVFAHWVVRISFDRGPGSVGGQDTFPAGFSGESSSFAAIRDLPSSGGTIAEDGMRMAWRSSFASDGPRTMAIPFNNAPANNPTRVGFTFAGWYSARINDNYPPGQVPDGVWPFDPTTQHEVNATYFARWIPNEPLRVTFYPQGGVFHGVDNPTERWVSPIVLEGQQLNDNRIAPIPTKPGHLFAGWFTTPEGTGVNITVSTVINEPITAYARYVPYIQMRFHANYSGNNTILTRRVPLGLSMQNIANIWSSAAGSIWNNRVLPPDFRITHSWYFNLTGIGHTPEFQRPGFSLQHMGSTLNSSMSSGDWGLIAWNTQPDASGSLFTHQTIISDPGNGVIDVYAHWTVNITLDSNRSTFVGDLTNSTQRHSVSEGFSFNTHHLHPNQQQAAALGMTTLGRSVLPMNESQWWDLRMPAHVDPPLQLIGWYSARTVDQPGIWLHETTTITEPMTFYAIWGGNNVFLSGAAPVGAVPIEPYAIPGLPLRPGEPFESSDLPPDPSSPGLKFVGWNLNPQGTGRWIDLGSTDTLPRQIFAVWDVNLLFDANGGTVWMPAQGQWVTQTSIETRAGGMLGQASMPLNPQRTGWEFHGWNTDRQGLLNGTGSSYNAQTVVTTSRNTDLMGIIQSQSSIYAQWVSRFVFDLNGGTMNGSDDEVTVLIPESATISNHTPTPTPPKGHEFSHWEIWDESSGQYVYFDINQPNTDSGPIVLVARYTPLTFNVTIQYRENGQPVGTPRTIQVVFGEGSPVSSTHAPSSANHVFIGWSVHHLYGAFANDGQLSTLFTLLHDGDITIYADFVVPSPWLLSIENFVFKSTLPQGQSPGGILYSGDALNLASGQAENWTFLGWTTETYMLEIGIHIDSVTLAPPPNLMPDNDLTVTAVWGSQTGIIGIPNTYNVQIVNVPGGLSHFDQNPASGMLLPVPVGTLLTSVLDAGTARRLPPHYHNWFHPTPYEFVGFSLDWDANESTGTLMSENARMPDNDIIVYAIWRPYRPITVVDIFNPSTNSYPLDLTAEDPNQSDEDLFFEDWHIVNRDAPTWFPEGTRQFIITPPPGTYFSQGQVPIINPPPGYVIVSSYVQHHGNQNERLPLSVRIAPGFNVYFDLDGGHIPVHDNMTWEVIGQDTGPLVRGLASGTYTWFCCVYNWSEPQRAGYLFDGWRDENGIEWRRSTGQDGALSNSMISQEHAGHTFTALWRVPSIFHVSTDVVPRNGGRISIVELLDPDYLNSDACDNLQDCPYYILGAYFCLCMFYSIEHDATGTDVTERSFIIFLAHPQEGFEFEGARIAFSMFGDDFDEFFSFMELIDMGLIMPMNVGYLLIIFPEGTMSDSHVVVHFVQTHIIIDVENDRNTTVSFPENGEVDYEITGDEPTDEGNIYVTFPPGTNPEDIVVNLPNNNWQYTIPPVGDGEYVVVIITPPTTTAPQTKSIIVNKVWDVENSTEIPSQVFVQLHKNGTAYRDPVILNAANNWRFEFADLYITGSSNERFVSLSSNVYTITMTPVSGFTSTYYDRIVSGVQNITITSTAIPNGSTAPPAENSSTAPPSENSSTAPPVENGSTAPPSENGSTAPPAENGSTAPPSENGSTAPPVENGSTAPPAENGSTAPPSENGSTAPTAENGSTAPPAYNGSTAPPSENGSTTPPSENGSNAPPSENGSTAPPAENGSTSPPVVDSTPSSTPAPPNPPAGSELVYWNGYYIVVDANNIPQGVWRFDDEAGTWIFDVSIPQGFALEFAQPIGLMPQTGNVTFASTFIAWLHIMGAAIAITATVLITKRRKKNI